MAALRHGCTTVIIPKDNARDLEEIDQTVRSQLNFVLASTADTVLQTALVRMPAPVQPAIAEIPETVVRQPALHQ